MKTVGEILKSARLKNGMKIREIVKKTKINFSYVKALEKNDFENLPEAAFVKGFIKNYSQTVGLDPAQVLAIFRRDYDQNIKGKVVPRDLTPDEVPKRQIWSPKTPFIVLLLLISIILGTYFIFQYKLLTSAPKLEVASPKEQETVTSTITVHGTTDPQATVMINNQQVIVNEDGTFSQALVLPSGTRIITVQTTNRSGKSRILQRTVNVR